MDKSLPSVILKPLSRLQGPLMLRTAEDISIAQRLPSTEQEPRPIIVRFNRHIAKVNKHIETKEKVGDIRKPEGYPYYG